jgi:hypothetical protein
MRPEEMYLSRRVTYVLLHRSLRAKSLKRLEVRGIARKRGGRRRCVTSRCVFSSLVQGLRSCAGTSPAF